MRITDKNAIGAPKAKIRNHIAKKLGWNPKFIRSVANEMSPVVITLIIVANRNSVFLPVFFRGFSFMPSFTWMVVF